MRPKSARSLLPWVRSSTSSVLSACTQPSLQPLMPVKIYNLAFFNSSDFWKTWLVHQFNMISEPQGLGIKSYPTHYSPDYPRLVSSRLSSLDVRGSVKIYSLALFNSSNFWKTWLVHQFNNFNIWCVLPYKRNRYIGSK
jgi:hypothetical protein